MELDVTERNFKNSVHAKIVVFPLSPIQISTVTGSIQVPDKFGFYMIYTLRFFLSATMGTLDHIGD